MSNDLFQWSIREAIQKYSHSFHNTAKVFSRNNKALFLGIVETDLKWHHNSRGQKFYSFTLRVERYNSSVDHIPVLISKSLITKSKLPHHLAGTFLQVAGQIRSYDLIIDGLRKLPLFVYAKNVSIIPSEPFIEKRTCTNAIFLSGYVDDYPILRSVCGNMHMTEFLLAVPGEYQKNMHHIPCALYGEYARLASPFECGDFMSLYGCFQSKVGSSSPYASCFMNDYNTAYEVFVIDI